MLFAKVSKIFPAVCRFVKSKIHFVAFETLMSIVLRFEYSPAYIYIYISFRAPKCLFRSRKNEKRKHFSRRHYFVYLDTWCNTVIKCVRTYGRTYGHHVTTKFSRLGGFNIILSMEAPLALFRLELR